MAQKARDQFLRQVIDVVRKSFPDVAVARGVGSFSLRIGRHTLSLEDLYRQVTLAPRDVDRQIEIWARDLLQAADGTALDRIEFDELRDRVMPMIVSEASCSGTDVPRARQPLVPGLCVAYTIDDERTITYIAEPHLQKWDVTVDDLHDAAIRNLVARSDSISARAAQDEDGRISLIIFQTMDGYDATRLLLPTLHDRLREHLGSPFVAAIPNRDILICFREETALMDRLRTRVREDYRTMPHQICDTFLLVTADGIAPCSP
jgi:hypothetical protein